MLMFAYHKPKMVHFFCFFAAAFIIRILLFEFYIGPNHYYHQPDSYDYHVGALCIATGNGMFRPDIKQPIFWRTPGYSYFLHFFYKAYGFINATFEAAMRAQEASIWFQIFLSSFIPLVLYALAYFLTHSYRIAWLVTGISVIHPSFILASSYLLSEGPSLIFFYIFLYAFFKIILDKNISLGYVSLAVFALSIYTWMRPMGLWVGIIATAIIIILASARIKKRFIIALFFITLFLSSLAPWYIRNYHYTHEVFFNPTLGPYLTCFCVPKILRRLYQIPLNEAVKIAQRNAAYEVEKRRKSIAHRGLFVSQEACKNYAIPVIKKNLGYFMYDWIVECIKTTFDLYSYQLVALATNTYSWDPLEEYLPEKLAQTLWQANIPFLSRIVGWIELLFMIMIWIGLITGLWTFLIKSLCIQRTITHNTRIWLVALLLCGATIGMTGGFGYARLRLPIEPLFMILGLIGLMKTRLRNSVALWHDISIYIRRNG